MYYKKLAALLIAGHLSGVAIASNSDVIASVHSTSEHSSAETLNLKRDIDLAISAFEQTDLNQWAYKVVRFENEEGDISSRIEQFDPKRQEALRWQLIQLNGEKPSEKQLKTYRKKKAKSAPQQSISLRLRELIQTDTLTLLEDNASHLRAQFSVSIPRLGKETSDKLNGNLLYNKQEQFIQSITIHNTASFSPMFAADMKKLNLGIEFIRSGDAVLATKQSLLMQGTYAFFTEINEVSEDTFSEYQYVGN